MANPSGAFPTRRAISASAWSPRPPRELEHIPAPDRERAGRARAALAGWQERCDGPPLRALAAEFVRRARARPPAGDMGLCHAPRESIAAAEKILLEAERLHPAEPTIQFNLGCYASQRGALAEARRRVDRAIGVGPKIRRTRRHPIRISRRCGRDPDCQARRVI